MRLAKELTEKERKQKAAKAALDEVKYVFLTLLSVFGFFAALAFNFWLILLIVSLFSSSAIQLIVSIGIVALEAFLWVFISAYRRNLK